MRILPNTKWSQLLEYAWVSIMGCLLFLGLGTFLAEPNGSYALSDVMPFMILLSFPSGLAVFLLAWPVIDLYPPIDYALLSLGVLAVGYTQWFRIVPKLGKIDITTLAIATSGFPHSSRNSAKKTCEPKGKQLKKLPSRIVHFDPLGQTPLERVINSAEEKRLHRSSLK